MTAILGGIPITEFLVVYPAPLESPGLPVDCAYEVGVGKVAATMGLYSLLLQLETRRPVRGVLLCGTAGACPERVRGSKPPVRLGQVCIVASDTLADEGVATAAGFLDLGAAREGQRLIDTGPFPANPRIANDAAAVFGAPLVRGATVSTCSGADDAARALYRRVHADVETMEGAAVAAVCRRREIPLLQLRAIGNWTGDRARGEWNLGAAVDALRHVLQPLFPGH